MFTIYDKTGNDVRLEIASLTYNGDFMGESFVSFDVDTPYPIDFEIGDYLEYRGERFVLNYTPSTIKNSSRLSSGNAFSYKDVKFNSLADELTRCDFLDYVLADNHVHFSGLSKFSFHVVSVKDLADRIQANLDRVYTGSNKWTVTVEDNVTANDKMITVDNINCWEALTLANSELDENFIIKGRVIKIGTEGLSVGKVLGYGKGNGLIKMEQSTNNDSLVVTRLRAFGSTRNIPYRYYNKLKDADGNLLLPESMYVPNLVLPGFAEAGGDAYVDSDNITSIGVREATVYFDGSGELQEIFPSIEGMTAEELKAAGKNVNATGRIDEIVSAEQMTDDGVVPEGKDELEKKTFTITLKDIGFNPVDDEHLTTETPYISIKSGWCGSRDFEITACEKKGDNYVLTCNREMDNSINKAFPNNPYQVSAGDYFVFIGIAMDDLYVKAASQRLLEAAKKYLAENDKSKYTYTPRIDNVFMARNPSIAMALKEGNILDFNDTDLGINASVIIQSVIIKEGGAVPEYEITLFNDKILSTIEKIQNSISSLANSTGITLEQAKSLFATWVEAWRVKWFDQTLHTFDDVNFKSVTSTDFESKVKGWIIDALGDVEFRDVLLRSFKSWNFASGPLGAGVGMVNDDELQTDKLLVRKIMYVLEMMIQRMRFQGGQMVLSPAAGFKVNSVEVFDTYYRLHCHPGDFNEFEVNDQARIQNFNGSDTKYLWSLVVAKGDDYIDISRVDKDGDGIPAEGDEIVQLGNRTNTNRQDAVLLSAANGEVGIFTYFGINSFDLSGKEGSWFGKHGDKKGAVIKGEVHITAGSDGLDKFNEYEEVSQDIQDAQASANEADRKAQAAQDFIDNTLPGELSELRGIIDGQIESFFYNYDPTMSNYPASSWTTTEDKERHLNDTFTNTSTGASWRFLKEGDEYKWVEIADTATKEALKLAGEAKSTAASKRRVFVVEPTPPYEVGDLWTQGVSGDLMRCVKERLSGSYVSSDWEKASKYTDDTKVDNLQIGMVNLLKGSNVELNKQAYNLGYYGYDNKPEAGKTYTLVCCYTLGDSNTYIGAYSSNGGYHVGNLSKKGTRVVESITFTAKITPTGNFDFYQFPNGTFGSTVHWAVLVEGNKGPNAWIPSLSEQGETAAKNEVNNLQIGGINLADYSGSNFLNALGLYDSSYASKGSIDGKTCLIFNRNSANCRFAPVTVENGEYTFSIWVKGSEEYDAQVLHYDGANYGATTVHVTTSWERKVMTFTAKAGTDVIHWGTKNTIYIADWKYEKGNKATDWSPSIADQNRYATEQGEAAAKDAVDNLQIGAVNLVSRKMMLAWNEKNKDIALWGQDSDGIYLAIEQLLLYYNVCGGSSNNDMFGGAIKYKNNTQYVISVKWKLAGVQSGNNAGLVIYVKYTDGTTTSVRLASTQTSLTREDLVTSKGKTVAKIYSSFGTNTYRSLVYSLALYEGNKALTEIPVATEDLQGQSNVNLVDGGKEVTVTAGASSTHSHTALVVPKLKPNTVYHLSFNASNLVGSPDKYSAILYNYENSTQFNDTLNSTSGGIIITRNNFTEGAYHLLLYAGAAGSTNGNSVKFTEVMLVEGFTPPSSYSPSPGDVQKEIEQSSTITKDDFAKEMGYESFQDMADKATEKGGKLVVDGLLNANLIDVETLAANKAFINKLSTNILTAGSITAEMLSVAGFTFEKNNIYGGSKFGEGAGVNIVSNTSERSFKAYKDENNFVSMFYNSANDWGLKGVVGGSTVFQLGNPEGEGTFIGPFNFTKTQLVSSDDVIINNTTYKQGFTLENNKLSFNRAVSSIYQRRVEMGIASTAYGSDTLLAVEGGDIWHQGTVTTPSGSSYTSRSCRFYSSDIHMRGVMKMYDDATITDFDGNVVVKNGISGGKIKNISIYGTSNTIASDYKVGLINLIGSSGCDTTLSPGGFIGQIIYLLNYTTSSCNLMRNDNKSKMAKLGGQKTAILYYTGTTWLPIAIVNTYEL